MAAAATTASKMATTLVAIATGGDTLAEMVSGVLAGNGPTQACVIYFAGADLRVLGFTTQQGG